MIILSDIDKTYFLKDHAVDVLKGINLEIKEGDFAAFMGESGSGKSTLMNIIGLLDQPTGGTYTFLDQRVDNLTESQSSAIRRKSFGFVFQKFNLLPRMSVLENVRLPLMLDGQKGPQTYERAHAVLEKVNLSDRALHKPNELSGGQQQRVAIARALVNNPDVIIADEPTGNLDPKMEEGVMELFHQLNAEKKTIIMVTHSRKVAKYAKTVIHLKNGNISIGQDSFYHRLLSDSTE